MPQGRSGAGHRRASGPSRRALLGGAATLPVLLTACGPVRGETAPPRPEVAVLTAAIGGEEALIALYEAARRAHAGLIPRLDPALAHHREHLSVLRRHYLPGTGAGGLRTAPQAPPTVPARAAQALAALRRAESRAAAARVRDVARVDPALAQLLAGIGACEAGHAAALVRRG